MGDHMFLPLSGRPPVMTANVTSYTNTQMELANVGRNLRFILTHSVTRRNLISSGILNFRVITHVHSSVLLLTAFAFRNVFVGNPSVQIGV